MLPQLADFLEREGGSVVAAFVLLFMGAGMFMLKIPKSEEIIMMAAGAIIMALKGKASRITTPAPTLEVPAVQSSTVKTPDIPPKP